jgi:putative oxygen-independent coproporphyrinogen III oxidase
MPGALPDGEPVPADGTLPESASRGLAERPFGLYVHVPFCTTRCGYCDFNTYTAAELGGTPGSAAVSVGSYPGLAIAEIGFARKVLAAAGHGADLPVRTVFFGGGTPTLMPASAFGRILRAIDAEFGLAPGAEVTTEANPESVDETTLSDLRAQGVNRVSFGMQSAVPGVLAVLDRVHQPGRPARCAAWARAAGFEHVSLDLIYGTPGETDADWRHSLAAAVAAGPDHVSAYALTVEPGTRLAARVRRGELPAPDDDVLAERYLVADEVLSAAGYGWYEISNWAASGSSRCAHNMLYWTDGDWWGIGPGGHSHVGGTRWWNVRHPAAYGARIGAGLSPGQAREILSRTERQLERVMLLIRLADGCPVEVLSPAGRANGPAVVADGLADPGAYAAGRIVLTSRGRLLADAVTRMLTELCELGEPSYPGLATCAQIQAGTSYRSPRLAAPMPRIMYFSTVSQSPRASGMVTTRATVRLSSVSRPPRIRQHNAYSSPVNDRLKAVAAWNRRNGDLRRPITYRTSGTSGPRKIAPT